MTITCIYRTGEANSQHTERYATFEEFTGALRLIRRHRDFALIELKVPLGDTGHVRDAMNRVGFRLEFTAQGSDIDTLHLVESVLEGAIKGAGAGASAGAVGGAIWGWLFPPPEPTTTMAVAKGVVGAAMGGTAAGAGTAMGGTAAGAGAGAAMGGTAAGAGATKALAAVAVSSVSPWAIVGGCIGMLTWAGVKAYRVVRDAPRVAIFSVQPALEPGYVRLLHWLLPSAPALA